jgi:REP-associated tyrosine transposase
MSRPLRIEFPGAWYHVMNRGRRAEQIFHDKKDYQTFVRLLVDTSEMWNLRVSAYCLMPNYYHLLVQTPDANISRAMRHVNGVYTQRFNRRHGSDGPLFRGRYKAILVSADSYLLQFVRYIHCNPVKADLAANLESYSYSSHKGYLSVAKKWDWLHKEFIYSLITDKKTTRIKAYRQFAAVDDDREISAIIEGKKWPSILGTQHFADRIKGQYFALKNHGEVPQSRSLAPEPESIITAVCRFYDLNREALNKSKRGVFNEPRGIAVFLMRKLRRDSLKTIGEQFGIEKYSTVSSIIERLKIMCSHDLGLNRRLEKISDEIGKSQGQP